MEFFSERGGFWSCFSKHDLQVESKKEDPPGCRQKVQIDSGLGAEIGI